MVIPQDMTQDFVRNMLPCNKLRLDDELEVQPEIMERISRCVVRANSRALEAKDSLEQIVARLSLDEKLDDPKLTKDLIEGAVRKNPERVRAWQKYQQARAEHEEWQGLYDAWRQKGFSLNKLCDLYASDYFSRDSHTVRGPDAATSRREVARAVREHIERHEPQEERRTAGRRALVGDA